MQEFVFTVSELNLATQKILEGHFSQIWVQGELSNLNRPISGHYYFTLKDPRAAIRCALFRNQAQRLTFDLRDGLQVQVKAKVSIYPDRGDYQLIVEQVELAGEGLLRQAFEQLVQKLKAKGLFEEHHKKPLPVFPNHIGIITSPTGAAIRDILTILKRRFPRLEVSIYPTKVQGTAASAEIVAAIEAANQHKLHDLLILARGGGSLEDLWCFNEEAVAQAIFVSQIPIITGIGHEIDFTIADFVADRRAATPSAAAELITPYQQSELLQQFIHLEKRLYNEITQLLNYRNQRLDDLSKRLKHPRQSIELFDERLATLLARLKQSLAETKKDKQRSFESAVRALMAVSPLSTLARGYAIVTAEESSSILRSIQEVVPGMQLEVKLQDGAFACQVQKIIKKEGADYSAPNLSADLTI